MKKMFLLLVVACGVLSGCATVTKKLDYNVANDSEMAFVYGKFKVDGAGNMGIVLAVEQDENHAPLAKSKQSHKMQQYGLKFNNDGSVYAIAVPPGKYHLSEFQYTSGWFDTLSKAKSIESPHFSEPFVVEKGKAYYVGDWRGGVENIYGYPYSTMRWKIKSVERRFTDASKEFDHHYLNLKQLVKVDVFLPPYSASFIDSDPTTYNEQDLKTAYEYGDYKLAHQMLSTLAVSSNTNYYKGMLNYFGQGVVEDKSIGLDLLKEAAASEHPDAVYRVGHEYLNLGAKLAKIETDPEDKKKWLKMSMGGLLYIKKSAELGNKIAMKRMCNFAPIDMPIVQNSAVAWCEIINEKGLTDERIDMQNSDVNLEEINASLNQERRIEIDAEKEKLVKLLATLELL